jgi:hypothetical protein
LDHHERVSTQRVGGGGTNLLNPFGPQWQRGRAAGEIGSIGQQVQQTLFGKQKPVILDAKNFPHLSQQMMLLKKFRRKITSMIGDSDDEYPMVLADGTIAMIDSEGRIYMGARFLEEQGDEPGVLVGALAHEIGHRPKRWGQYVAERELSKDEMQAICREEEAKADAFAGTALAEMRLSPEPIVDFLRAIQDQPHPEYFSVDIRADIIKEAHKGRSFRANLRKKLFPHLDRMTSPKNHLGDF